MLQALYDFRTGYWGFFLFYWIFVTSVMLSRQIFAFVFYQLLKSGKILAHRPQKRDVTMFVTIFDEDPDIVEQGLSSVRASFDEHCSRFDMVVIIDGADIHPEETKVMIEKVTPFADVLLTTNARKKRQNLRNMVKEAKRKNILHEISCFLDSDTILDDEDVARELLRPFADPRIGGVTTAQRGLEPKTIPEFIGDWLENARLFSSMAAGSLFGQVGCLPGRLYAVRSSILAHRMDDLVEDYWNVGVFNRRRVQCVAGDDRVISNWVLQAGYNTVMMPSAGVRTVLPHTWVKMLKTWERWGRSSQGYTLRTLHWSWKKLWVFYQNVTDILITVSTVYLICINWPHSFIFGESDRPHWPVALAIACGGMTLTVLIRQLMYLSFNPKALFTVPFFILAVTLGQFARFKALVTPSRKGVWGTRRGADSHRAEGVWVQYEYISPAVEEMPFEVRLSDEDASDDESLDPPELDYQYPEKLSRDERRRRWCFATFNALCISAIVAIALTAASGAFENTISKL